MGAYTESNNAPVWKWFGHTARIIMLWISLWINNCHFLKYKLDDPLITETQVIQKKWLIWEMTWICRLTRPGLPWSVFTFCLLCTKYLDNGIQHSWTWHTYTPPPAAWMATILGNLQMLPIPTVDPRLANTNPMLDENLCNVHNNKHKPSYSMITVYWLSVCDPNYLYGVTVHVQ